MMSAAVVNVRSTALQTNLERARASAPGAKVLAVVKANAYGHGLTDVAHALAAADAYAVARIEEAISLRDSGIIKPLVLLGGWLDLEIAAQAREHDIQLVIHHPHQVELLEALVGHDELSVWLKIDTGMGRLGVLPELFASVMRRLGDCAVVRDDPVLMTHLACADELDNPSTDDQLRCFAATIGDWRGDVSVANSAGILGWPGALRAGPVLKYQGDNWLRPGLMLYGVSPFPDRSAESLGLVPAMTLQGRLVSIREVPVGGRVGYGGDWQARRSSRIGVVDVGYADGYPWRIPGGTLVRIGNSEAPVVGRISMDMLSCDLTDLAQVSLGDPVVLWGQGPTVSDLAERVGTSAYELLTGVGSRLPRRLL
jgi:alanine racemase